MSDSDLIPHAASLSATVELEGEQMSLRTFFEANNWFAEMGSIQYCLEIGRDLQATREHKVDQGNGEFTILKLVKEG